MALPEVAPAPTTATHQRFARHLVLPAVARVRPLTAVGMFAAAFLLRYVHVQQAYDIFIDEITYARISESVAAHHTVEFFGAPFFLHPPVSFFFFAFFIDAFHIHGSIFAVVFGLRTVNVLFGAGSALCLLALGTRLAGRAAGLVASGLYAIDPFLIRFDGRVFLEPSTLFFVLLGYLLVLAGIQGPQGGRHTGRLTALACGGLALGLAILCNENAVPLVLGPLGLCAMTGWPVRRRAVLVPLAMVLVVLAAYVLTIAALGQTHNFVDQQILGFRRLSGADQMTGFNKPGAPSLLSRVDAHLRGYFGVYTVLGLSIAPLAWLLAKGTDVQRLAAIVAVSADVLLAYQVTFGTIEEQMFYYADVPAILVIGLGIACLFRDRRVRRLHAPKRGALERARQVPGRLLALRAASAIVVLGVVAVDAHTWVDIHTTTDAELQDAIRWIDDNVPAGSRVSPLVDTAQLLLSKYQVYVAGTPAQIERAKPSYVLTSSLQVQQHYGYASADLMAWLRRSAQPVARYRGRSFGTITIWSLPYPTAAGAPPGFASITANLPRQPVGEG